MEENAGHSITRRRFIGAVSAVGLAAVGAGLLGGCSSPRAESPSASAASSSAQGGAASSSAISSSASGQAQKPASNAILVVFSWSGNTLAVADRVAEGLKSELFRIEPATPYTTNYDEMLQIAQDELAAGTLPALAGGVGDWAGYSTVYLGFPTWWGHMPQIVKSFLAAHDCSGKVVFPFNTHGGSGFASCLTYLAGACPGADIRDGLSLSGNSVSASSAQIDSWLAASV